MSVDFGIHVDLWTKHPWISGNVYILYFVCLASLNLNILWVFYVLGNNLRTLKKITRVHFLKCFMPVEKHKMYLQFITKNKTSTYMSNISSLEEIIEGTLEVLIYISQSPSLSHNILCLPPNPHVSVKFLTFFSLIMSPSYMHIQTTLDL